MKYGDQANQARDPMTYGEEKAEYDGVIAGLAIALAREGQPESLCDLQDRLQRGLVQTPGILSERGAVDAKGPIADIVGGAVKPLTDAIVAIWSSTRDDDALMRKTIQTQLEATSWPPFDVVPSQPLVRLVQRVRQSSAPAPPGPHKTFARFIYRSFGRTIEDRLFPDGPAFKRTFVSCFNGQSARLRNRGTSESGIWSCSTGPYRP